jgi:hypothetical protein
LSSAGRTSLGQRPARRGVGGITAGRDALAQHAKHIPRLFLVESEYDLAVQEAEAAWIRCLLAELTSGTYPGLDAWRAFHETGEVPPELTELAERTSSTE